MKVSLIKNNIEKELDDMIHKLDNFILHYCNNFNRNKKIIFNDLKINTSCTTERTIAIVANSFLRNFFYEKFTLEFYSDELQIKFNEQVNGSGELKSQVGNYTEKENWNNCYIDGYFEIYCDSELIHFFVEYKMESKFTFAKLATDYLKYKLYTQHAIGNTIFSYIIFKKNEDYPTIIDRVNDGETYVLLDKYISKEIPISNCYFHINDGERTELFPSNETTVNYKESIYHLEKISNCCDKLECFGGFDNYSTYQKIFIEGITKFNTNVFDSNLLKENYKYLKSVYDFSIKNDLFLKHKKIYESNEINYTECDLQTFIFEACNYKTNLIINLVQEDRFEAETVGLAVGTRISLFIIMLVDYFVEKYGIKIEETSLFYDKITKINGEKVEISIKNQTEKIIFEKINNIYVDESLKEKFDQNIFGLLYFIIKTYPIVYKIVDGVVESVSESKQALKIIESIQGNVKELKKIYGKEIGDVSVENYKKDINNVCMNIIQNNNKAISK